MNFRRSARRHAFSLIEVLLVVVILAILASVVIPTFFPVSDNAKDSVLLKDLRTLREQIEVYKVQHGWTLPTVQGNSLPQLTEASDDAGATGSSGPGFPHGPYLSAIPLNPYTQSNTVSAVASFPPATAPETGGWLYHEASGQIMPDLQRYIDEGGLSP